MVFKCKKLLRPSHAIPSHQFGMIINGEVVPLKNAISTSFPNDNDSRLSDLKWGSDDDTMLHIAAGAGQSKLITVLLKRDQELLYCQNKKGDLPIHVCVRAGHILAVQTLIQQGEESPVIGKLTHQLEQENNHKDTALHIALSYQHKELARYLFDKNQNTFYCMNAQGICPLYLAITASIWDLVIDMLSHCSLQLIQEILKNGRSVVLAVIMARNIDLLKIMDEECGNLVASATWEGRTMMSHAANIGFLEAVKFLLKKHPELSYQCDEDDGSFPIHRACIRGDVQIVQIFLSCSSNMKHLRNNNDQNIFQVAACYGHHDVIIYLLGLQANEDTELINAKDSDGNTPLHLAALGKHSKVVYTLTRDERVNLTLLNIQGLTALDLANKYYGHQLPELLVWLALASADVPRTTWSMNQGTPIPHVFNESPNGISSQTSIDTEPIRNKDINYDTLLLVATLLATVAFSASFTIDDHNKSSTQAVEMASLTYKCVLLVFVVSNTIAMVSSTAAIMTIIGRKHFGDRKFSLQCLNFVLSLLGISLHNDVACPHGRFVNSVADYK